MRDFTQVKSAQPLGQFFAVGREEFHIACELGMNAACLYLVQACGSGRDNIKTSWSRNALSNYTGISRSRAKTAQETILKSTQPLMKQTKSGKHPKFEFIRDEESELVWLPATFVIGASDETPPLELIRQTGDVMTLLLAVDIYAKTNIADEGGLSRDSVFRHLKRTRIASHGQYEIYGFDEADVATAQGNNPLVAAHLYTLGNKKIYDHFWRRLATLVEDLRLFFWVPTVFESEEGEPLVPLVDPFTGDVASEDILNFSCSLLTEEYDHVFAEYTCVLAFPRHLVSVQVYEVLVPRYRQKTGLTAAGFAVTQDRLESWLAVYKSPDPAISREYQGNIKGYSRANQR